VLFTGRPSLAQTIQRYEAILIDTSGSIAKRGASSDLFPEYLFSTKKLLLTEPANSRVWVSIISTDSFGGVQEILKGWTPDARGVFTDDLNRARHQLASGFEAKSSGMSPVAAGTDIFGGLWHLKALFVGSEGQYVSHSAENNLDLLGYGERNAELSHAGIDRNRSRRDAGARESKWATGSTGRLQNLHSWSVAERPHTSGLARGEEILDDVLLGGRC